MAATQRPVAEPAFSETSQPSEPQWMTWGGLSSSRIFSSAARPSVSSACRVSSGRSSGSLDHAVSLISITTGATLRTPGDLPDDGADGIAAAEAESARSAGAHHLRYR
jgi:hypothetical protein